MNWEITSFSYFINIEEMTINLIIADIVSQNQLKQIHKDSGSKDYAENNLINKISTPSDYDFNVYAWIVEVKLLKKI